MSANAHATWGEVSVNASDQTSWRLADLDEPYCVLIAIHQALLGRSTQARLAMGGLGRRQFGRLMSSKGNI